MQCLQQTVTQSKFLRSLNVFVPRQTATNVSTCMNKHSEMCATSSINFCQILYANVTDCHNANYLGRAIGIFEICQVEW